MNKHGVPDSNLFIQIQISPLYKNIPNKNEYVGMV